MTLSKRSKSALDILKLWSRCSPPAAIPQSAGTLIRDERWFLSFFPRDEAGNVSRLTTTTGALSESPLLLAREDFERLLL